MKEDQNYIDVPALLLALKERNERLAELTAKSNQAIAIIGASCRFAGGANTPNDYWDLLSSGRDAIIGVPNDRWRLDEYYDPDAPGKMYCKWGGVLNTNVAEFDNKFFEIQPLEVQGIDPQQRLELEVSW